MTCCPICNSKSTKQLKIHFYKYLQCNRCEHIWNCADEKSIKHQLSKLRGRQRSVYKETIQNTLTSNHIERKRFENSIRLYLIEEFSENPSRLLELNCQDGSLESLLDESVSYQGLSTDKFYQPHLSANARIGDASSIHANERFDTILLVDYIEFCYDPYNDIVKCLSRLNKTGKIIISVPLNKSPAKEYSAAAHCFSETSVRTLAKNITKNYEIVESLETATVIIRP